MWLREVVHSRTGSSAPVLCLLILVLLLTVASLCFHYQRLETPNYSEEVSLVIQDSYGQFTANLTVDEIALGLSGMGQKMEERMKPRAVEDMIRPIYTLNLLLGTKNHLVATGLLDSLWVLGVSFVGILFVWSLWSHPKLPWNDLDLEENESLRDSTSTTMGRIMESGRRSRPSVTPIIFYIIFISFTVLVIAVPVVEQASQSTTLYQFARYSFGIDYTMEGSSEALNYTIFTVALLAKVSCMLMFGYMAAELHNTF